jgi:hypothetical protein
LSFNRSSRQVDATFAVGPNRHPLSLSITNTNTEGENDVKVETDLFLLEEGTFFLFFIIFYFLFLFSFCPVVEKIGLGTSKLSYTANFALAQNIRRLTLRTRDLGTTLSTDRAGQRDL